MKCKHCDGVGFFGNGASQFKCVYCDGTGEVQTNEEWFCSLPTEEKVNALLKLHEKVRQRMKTELGGENSFYNGDYYREWLKQPHKGVAE